jgi:hypothetical protein
LATPFFAVKGAVRGENPPFISENAVHIAAHHGKSAMAAPFYAPKSKIISQCNISCDFSFTPFPARRASILGAVRQCREEEKLVAWEASGDLRRGTPAQIAPWTRRQMIYAEADDVGDTRRATISRIKVVPGGGIEPPTRGFSIRCSTN